MANPLTKTKNRLKMYFYEAINDNILTLANQYEALLQSNTLMARLEAYTFMAKTLSEQANKCLEQSASIKRKIEAQRKRQHLIATCPHCGDFFNPKDLRALAESSLVKGIWRKSYDMGEFYGFRYEDVPVDFSVVKCPSCKKKMYAECSDSAPVPFNGKIFPGPVACY